MPNYTTPGVFIEEVPATGPIAGVGTSTAAFIGPTLQGATNVPTKVTNWTQFKTRFGDYTSDAAPATGKRFYTPAAVQGFFNNGGTIAYIVPVEVPAGTDKTPGVPGQTQYKKALDTLAAIGDVNLVCLCVTEGLDAKVLKAIQDDVVTHCTTMRDRFAILDAPAGITPPFKNPLQMSVPASTNGYAAFYYPWISVSDPASKENKTVLVPPSGHLAGIYARSDALRGVHKAPANEPIFGARDLETLLNDTDQGILNEKGVNVLRIFPGQLPIVWGARTTTDQVPFRYINVRRLFIFIERSLIEGLRWAIFEPNDTALWKKLERTVSEFLSRVWRSGALFGRKASEAFYVKIDEELNTDDTRQLGQVIIEIGIAPVRPAEFVIVRIAMWDGVSQASEG